MDHAGGLLKRLSAIQDQLQLARGRRHLPNPQQRQRLRPVRHVGQCLGVGERLVCQGLLHELRAQQHRHQPAGADRRRPDARRQTVSRLARGQLVQRGGVLRPRPRRESRSVLLPRSGRPERSVVPRRLPSGAAWLRECGRDGRDADQPGLRPPLHGRPGSRCCGQSVLL